MTWNWGMLPYVVVLLLMAWRVWRLEATVYATQRDQIEALGREMPREARLLNWENEVLCRCTAATEQRVRALARALGYEWKRTDAKEGWEKRKALSLGHTIHGHTYQVALDSEIDDLAYSLFGLTAARPTAGSRFRSRRRRRRGPERSEDRSVPPTESQRQEQYRSTVYAPAQDARKAYWQSMWERSMSNPLNKVNYDNVEMLGDLPYPERQDNRWTGSPDPWKGVRGTAEPCCKEPFTDKDLSILTEAHGLVYGDRQASYGHPAVDFARTAALVNTLLASKLSKDLGPEDVALFMVAVKLSRECHEPARDNLVDAAGYLECRARVLRFLGGDK